MNINLIRVLKACSMALIISNTNVALAEEDFLFEVLEKPAYLNSWNKLIASEKAVEPWLANYAETKNGPTTPATKEVSGNTNYQINFVCKTHECGDNQFYVLFSEDGHQAWGLLLTPDNREIFFGSPDEEKMTLLKKEAYSQQQ